MYVCVYMCVYVCSMCKLMPVEAIRRFFWIWSQRQMLAAGSGFLQEPRVLLTTELSFWPFKDALKLCRVFCLHGCQCTTGLQYLQRLEDGTDPPGPLQGGRPVLFSL